MGIDCRCYSYLFSVNSLEFKSEPDKSVIMRGKIQSIFVAVSDHGLGHVSQVIPVINELDRRNEGLLVTIQTAGNHSTIADRITASIQFIEESADIGMIMDDALTVNVAENMAAYKGFHSGWERRLQRELQIIQSVNPDIILCDVPYLPLVCAKVLGIPSVAMCSLNWADVLAAYAADDTCLMRIVESIKNAYRCTNLFLQPEPSMPMPWLRNRRKIGSVGVKYEGNRRELVRQIGIPVDSRIVLIALGGIEVSLPIEDLPKIEKVFWVVKDGLRLDRSDVIAIESLDLPFGKLLASVDAVVTKPGYGIFVEAVSNQIPVLYFERGDWPEEPYLSTWLEEKGIGMKISGSRPNFKGIEVPLLEAMAREKKLPLQLTGVIQAVDYLQQVFDEHSIIKLTK